MRASLLFFVVSSFSAQLLAVPATSQVPDSASRVRATVRGNRLPVIGTFHSVTADTVKLSSGNGGPTQLVLISSLTRLEVSKGRRGGGHGTVGALLGGLTGLVVGFLVGRNSSDCVDDCTNGMAQSEAAITLGGAGLLVGGGVGYFIGARNPEKWERVNLDELRRD